MKSHHLFTSGIWIIVAGIVLTLWGAIANWCLPINLSPIVWCGVAGLIAGIAMVSASVVVKIFEERKRYHSDYSDYEQRKRIGSS